MSQSLLAHLYNRIKGSQEDVATLSLQYIISNNNEMKEAFSQLIERALHISIDSELQYICQATGDNKERPDMAGIDSGGNEIILCEMKFYAGLTNNQPLGYIDRLVTNNGKGLIFVCPKVRTTSLWSKICGICTDRTVEKISEHCISVNGIHLAIISWGEILDQLRRTVSVSARECQSDLDQLIGLCEKMDSDAFIPFTDEDLSPEIAKKAERHYTVVDKTIALLCADESLDTSTERLQGRANRDGYIKSVYIDEFVVMLEYSRQLWKDSSKIDSPFWVAVCTRDWKQTDDMKKKIRHIDPLKKDDMNYNYFYLALEPLTEATLDEVCLDMKRQVIEWVDLFR